MSTKSRPAAARKTSAPNQPRQPAAERPVAPSPQPAAEKARPRRTSLPAAASGAARPDRTAAPAPTSPTRREQRQRDEELACALRRPRERRLRWIAGGIVALALVGGAVFGVSQAAKSAKPTALNETRQPPSGYSQHVPVGTDIKYAFEPPSSGPHYPTPANWGVYSQALPKGTWVHNLEHGGVVVLYRCDGSCTQTQQQMQALYHQLPNESKFNERKVVITPYDGLDQPVRVQAWGWTMPLDHVDQTQIDAFYKEHVDQGPEQVP